MIRSQPCQPETSGSHIQAMCDRGGRRIIVVMEWQLEITSTAEPAGLRLAGEIDMATVPALELALEPFLDAGGDVVLNLVGLTFIDVAGMRVLADTASQLRLAGLRLRLVQASSHVRMVSGLLGWDRLLGLARTYA